MPEFIYFVEPKRKTFPGDGTPEEFEIIGEHMEFLRAKLASGELILVGRTQDDQPIGLTVFEAEDIDAANLFAKEDPAVAKGLFSFTIRPYHVFLMRGRDN